MRAAARRNAVAAEAAAVSLDLHLPDAPLLATFDRGALAQILDNLLANAIRFSPAGGTVDLTGRLDAGQVLLSVVDHGPGGDPAARARLFDKFASTAAPGRKAILHQPRGRLVLGLFIAATFATRMGATLGFRDALPSGAIFELVLPRP